MSLPRQTKPAMPSSKDEDLLALSRRLYEGGRDALHAGAGLTKELGEAAREYARRAGDLRRGARAADEKEALLRDIKARCLTAAFRRHFAKQPPAVPPPEACVPMAPVPIETWREVLVRGGDGRLYAGIVLPRAHNAERAVYLPAIDDAVWVREGDMFREAPWAPRALSVASEARRGIKSAPSRHRDEEEYVVRADGARDPRYGAAGIAGAEGRAGRD